MINITLILIILALSLVKRDKASMIFASITGLYSIPAIYIPDSQGLTYYLSAAISDLLIIVIIGRLSIINHCAIDLQNVSKVFIGVNFIGWLMWLTYQPPTIYNILSSILYLSAIVTISSIKGSDNAGSNIGNQYSSGTVGFPGHSYTRNIEMQRNKEAANS